jgi:hypothetical protein
MGKEQWDSYLNQTKIVNNFEDNEFMNKIATKILRKLESTEEKLVFKYLESQCTQIGLKIAEQTLHNKNPNIWLPSLHKMIASTFCMGIAIGAGEDIDEILD